MIDYKLQKLRDNVSYYEWKYESCHRFWKKEYWNEIKKAKAKLKEYKAKYYPETQLLTQPKPFVRMDDWSEEMEYFNLNN